MASNAAHILVCAQCGHHFKSFFAGAVSAIGNTESCPRCGAPISTPMFFGHHNVDVFQRATAEPMLRIYGDHGYVYMGRGLIVYEVQSSEIVPVLNAYMRNIYRGLDLIDVYQNSSPDLYHNILGQIYLLTHTAFERVVDDLVGVMVDLGQIGDKKGTLVMRRDKLFACLGYVTPCGHVTALDYLYAYRNCLAHNAGLIDAGFIKRVTALGYPSHLPQLVEGNPLELNFETALSFLDSVQQLSQDLLLRADKVAQSIAKP